MPATADPDKALDREIGAFRDDPPGFVMFAFPPSIRLPAPDRRGRDLKRLQTP